MVSAVFFIISAPFWFFGLLFLITSPWAQARKNGVPIPEQRYFAKLIFMGIGLLGISIAATLTIIALSF